MKEVKIQGRVSIQKYGNKTVILAISNETLPIDIVGEAELTIKYHKAGSTHNLYGTPDKLLLEGLGASDKKVATLYDNKAALAWERYLELKKLIHVADNGSEKQVELIKELLKLSGKYHFASK